MATATQKQTGNVVSGADGLADEQISELNSAFVSDQWPFDALGITETDILIADLALTDMLNDVKGGRKTRIVVPDAFAFDAPDTAARVFVMLLDGELAYVRNLKNQHPDLTIISVTYGARGSFVDLASLAAQGMDLTIIISAPSSGTGYLTNLIEANKLANSTVSLMHAETAWAKCQLDFDLVRCIVGKLYGKQGHVIVELGLGLIDHLRSMGALRSEKIKSFVSVAEARVISMTRRNRADQVALMTTKGKANPLEPDARALLPIVLELIAAEARLEQLLSLLPIFRTITFEELAESPVEVLKMLGSFFEKKTMRNILVVDPAAEELQAAWKNSFRAHYKQAVIEFMGLSKNKKGSYQTKTEQIRSA